MNNHLNLINNNLTNINLYIETLLKWNKTYNLTAAKTYNDIYNNHIIDCAYLINYLKEDNYNWIDIGSGSGLPGIVLAIIYPKQQITLLDSNGKKIQFLTYIKQLLNLTNITIIYNRVELYKPNIKYNIIMSRAFSNLNNFLNITYHLSNNKTNWITFKSINYNNELININSKFKLQNNIKYNLNDKINHLLIFNQTN